MKTMLIVSDVAFSPANEGNRKRISDLIEAYEKLGIDVTVILIEGTGNIEEMRKRLGGRLLVCHRSPIERLRILFGRILRFGMGLIGMHRWRNYPLDSWGCKAAQSAVRSLGEGKAFDFVQCQYLYLSACLEVANDNSIKIIDTNDLMSDRWRMFPPDEVPNVWYSLSKRDELVGCRRADVVLAISRTDQRHFNDLGVIGVELCDFIAPPRSLWSPTSRRVIFLGSDNRMNRSGLRWLVEEVLPLVLREAPDFRLSVAGRVAAHFSKHEGIEIVGEFTSLDELFADCRFMLNPVSLGTGLAIKNLDALSRGIPIICTTNAARGIEEFCGRGVAIASNAIDFANLVVDQWRNVDVLNKQSELLGLAYGTAYAASMRRLATIFARADEESAQR
ncbi:glycosyltransferase [Stenotrophomonas sp. YIM B06876]|uniref:glycosyltransferase n=1 Tax=Stenotrophomonas sp. YIM B06876 TaxID=3060211 RepID=UPI002739111D|nr:glycosyltransferase [Stenotrophomonas sp. YIM B06876]